MTLSALVETCMDAIRVDWLGVYQSRGDSLVKLAYRGAPSRAEFPLTAEFAKKSNNVTVALFGKPVVIGDVRAHAAAGGAYYECAPTVRSEACLPILSNEGRVVGIIDAEHSVEQTFDAERLAFMSVLACAVVAHLPGQ
jgi:putative methionine-R-sulfoxide reductase with GAF domain